MSTEIAIIRRAREIISDPERWTQGTYARDKNGAPVHPGDDEATCWCALGALAKAAREMRAAPGMGAGAADKLAGHIAECHRGHIATVNDSGSMLEAHAAVLSLFDKALAEEVSP